MRRHEFPGKIRVAAWERCRGQCENCTRRLSPGDIYYEHLVPAALAGQATLENCGVYCKSCWTDKTRTYDVPVTAKAKRQQRRFISIKRSRNPIRGWKKFDGTAVKNPRA
jgi:5-methylcytosine-specific restriction enzyme A